MNGTLVRLFPQSEGYDEPVPVELSPPAGSVGRGPTDPTLRAVLPEDKDAPYDPPHYLPPYRGPVVAPAEPNAFGHFDHISVESPQFLSQHLYGGVRRTLDCWERYLGRPVIWWHARERPQLELIPILDWDNAHSGPGFIETGVRHTRAGVPRLFALNLDVIAHETGHAILFAEVGAPEPAGLTPGYLAFQESFSDLVALVTALHFPMVVDRLLEQTRGNLYILNLVARIGELSGVEQIRVADNTTTIADVADLRLAPDGEWIDPTGQDRTEHDLAQPLTGAIFDVLVDLFQDNLVRAGVIPPRFDARGWDAASVEASFDELEAVTGDALGAYEDVFRQSLAEARDWVGACMARTMRTIDPEGLSFEAVAACMIRAAADLGLERVEPAFLENFLLRGIDPRPLLHRQAAFASAWQRMSYAERRRRWASLPKRRSAPSPRGIIIARSMMPHTHRNLE